MTAQPVIVDGQRVLFCQSIRPNEQPRNSTTFSMHGMHYSRPTSTELKPMSSVVYLDRSARASHTPRGVLLDLLSD